MTRMQIIRICQEVHKQCTDRSTRYALVGGGLFQYLRLGFYVTHDLDFAADQTPGFPWETPDIASPSGWENHFLIEGVMIDWLDRSDELRDLYLDAIEHATIGKHGFYYASLAHTIAIKLSADRDKDWDVCERLRTFVHEKQVQDLLDEFNPDLERKYYGVGTVARNTKDN